MACNKYRQCLRGIYTLRLLVCSLNHGRIIIDELGLEAQGVTVQQYIDDYFYYIKSYSASKSGPELLIC